MQTIILSSNSAEGLQDQINVKLEEGYAIYGEVIVKQVQGEPAIFYFVMTK